MNGARIDGALQFPVFLLVWSAGLLFFFGGFYRADAALVSFSQVSYAALPAVPSLTEVGEFAKDLDTALRTSQVMTGDWQPKLAETTIATKPKDESEISRQLPLASEEEEKEKKKEKEKEKGKGKEKEAPELIDTARVAKPVYTPRTLPDVRGTPVATMTKRHVANPAVRVDSRISQWRSMAREALAVGDSVSAYRLLMSNLSKGAEDIDYLALLGVAALELQRPEEALLVYEKLIKLSRSDSRWWMGLAVCQEHLGIDAAPLYEEVVRLTEAGSALQILALDKLDSARNLS